MITRKVTYITLAISSLVICLLIFGKIRWAPDIHKLASPADREDRRSLYGAVKNFYELVRDERWNETYDYKTAAFRNLVSKEGYVSEMSKIRNWKLVNYNIKTVGYFRNNSGESARLIVEFVEREKDSNHFSFDWKIAGLRISYGLERMCFVNAILWKREAGVWRCEEEGPSKLPFFGFVIRE